ncbi:MAG: alpha/beta fold hydrolase [Anaerolineae bacterium]|nr:alpha/beta fold hydrolase [Anaerolineae bacterium]MDK1117504.1 alpha/beta fold hydrolase [Anaerolineae bacterium]
MNLFVIGFSGLFVFGLVGLLLLSHWQANNYVHPRRLEPPSGELLRQNGIVYQEIELFTSDGIRLVAWYTPPKNGALILLAHGYADRRSEDFYSLFAEHDFGVLAWDFRGHGASEGDLVSLGFYETKDVEAALEYALSQPEVEHIGAWGGSMGAVAVIRTAAKRPEIEALVADSPFATLEDELDLRVQNPLLNSMIRFFVERETGLRLDKVRPVDDIGLLSPRPVFLIQGTGDTMIPVDSAERLYHAAGEPRQLWTEADVPHMNMYFYYPAKYTKRVINFFNIHLLKE